MGYPATRAQLMAAAEGRIVDGWDLPFFLGAALGRSKYRDLRSVLADVEAWLEKQG